MSEGGDSAGMSVGRALQSNVAFSINHPLYRTLADTMERKVAELSSVRGAMRASAEVSFVTIALSAEDLATLAVLFPEFRFSNYGAMKPAHGLFVQVRRLACEWLLLQASKMAESVVVYGTPLLAALESSVERVTMVVDPTSPVAIHERHSVSFDAHRLYANFVEVSAACGRVMSRSSYDAFLRGTGTRFATAVRDIGVADVICVDGILNAYSPWQVAACMVSAQASVAFGFFPYHPTMVLNESGEMPGFGVHFERVNGDVLFKYPDGMAGVARYAEDAWEAWLVGHTFSLGRNGGHWFQIELLKNRGCVMFYRMVRLQERPEVQELVHALEVPSEQPLYVVRSARLKSLGANPNRADSWHAVSYLVAQRLVDRVYQFAMQLPREQFTRYAIRKQIHVVNDRVTVEGTMVKVNSRLGELMVDALVVDVFARAFVDRYNSGMLTDQVKSYVDGYLAFSSGSFVQRLWFVTVTCSLAAWEVSLAPFNRYLRNVADSVRRWCSPGPSLEVPVFAVAPSYLLVDAAHRVRLDGKAAVVRELGRRAALGASGLHSELVRTMAQLQGPVVDALQTSFKSVVVPLFTTEGAAGGDVEQVVDMMRALNPVDEAPVARRMLEVSTAVRVLENPGVQHFNPVADPVFTLNEFYSAVLPGVAEQNLEYDTASISLDPQDRVLAAPYLKLPRYFGDAPKPKAYYRSRLRALNVPKRQQTLQELLSAIAARNLNAPQVALPQDDAITARAVWENFLDTACVADARSILVGFKRDSVSLSEEGFREWASQSTPDRLAAVKRELVEKSQALGEMDVGDYLVMLKADVKPTLSKKPLDSRTEPQVIVYHEKALSSFYSALFRVLVRRFLSLLKPNFHVNLLKDTKDMEAFVRGIHPFDVGDLKYLENDFSKYDKSQGKFVFVLEELVFSQLGMDRELLAQWLGGHVECNLRAVSLGLSLHVLYQRKSGDATTSFGNVLLNAMSVMYAYQGTEVVWALFMGDDSLVCARAVGRREEAVRVLAEVFNLGAKTYLTDAPYFASNFVVIDAIGRRVHFVPDPVKRIERWSMAVSADSPSWHERYVSARDSMQVYLDCSKTTLLPRLVEERYAVKSAAARGTADAIATVVASEKVFRSMWEDKPETSLY